MSADGLAAILTDDRDARYATVDQLVALFSYASAKTRDEQARTTTHRGHCGWFGEGSLGFDDGYDMMGKLPSNWRPIPDAGDWPYLMFWIDRVQRAILSYCERDFTLVVADDDDALKSLVRATIATYAAP